jgi:uncharacterized integral membrane protein
MHLNAQDEDPPMLRKIVTTLVIVPLGILIVVAALANRQPVTVSLDPFLSGYRPFSVTQPLFVILLAILIVGVIIGGVATWLRQGRWRRAARRASAETRTLRVEADLLRKRLDAAERQAHAQARLPSLVYRPPPAA